jgi:HAD superfamily hydrolase (TIGR01509 family)
MDMAAIVDWLLDRVVAATMERVPWQPGAFELLRALAAAGVPSALVTASYRRFADVVVSAADGLLVASVAGDEVTNGKPDPEAFVKAARLLGVAPSKCVAIEDSPPGIAAAMASGARVLGAEAMVPLPDIPGLSRTTSLTAVGLEQIARIASGEVLDLRRR